MSKIIIYCDECGAKEETNLSPINKKNIKSPHLLLPPLWRFKNGKIICKKCFFAYLDTPQTRPA